ncbi:high mobility group protein 20a [Plakobranchus ocellatus]|uniref:High mobility group protein 20a n=1 Tax=Plakobranchus ocellatus TaxID=259542 RepID=A0AAV4DD34_9GAST|nr:high mobility group protein 20a [Plakobranchus ocellatus]
MENDLLSTVQGDEASGVVGLHVLSTDYVHGSETVMEDFSSDDCSRKVIAIPSLPSEASSSILEKDGEITLNSSFIPENAVLMETSRGLMLTIPENINAISYGGDNSPVEQSQQLLSCIPVSLFSACDSTPDVDSSADYGAELSNDNDGSNIRGDDVQNQEHHPKIHSEHGEEVISDQPLTDEATEICVTTKRKGGWPKGKKRKIKPIVTGPRGPVTGYVLYAMDRRKEIKESHPEIAFSEVTKILGQEWSTMAHDVKQKYLAAAEEDKKRYREELKAFKSSDAYRETVRKKMLANGELAPMVESNDILNCDEGNSDELHCKLCNVYFNNLHNKREHMYGKVHVQNVAGAIEKQLLRQQQEEQAYMDGALVVSEDLSQDSCPSSLKSNGHGESINRLEKPSGPVDIHGFMMEFIHKNYEREHEISVLKKCLNKAFQDNVAMCKEIQALQEYQSKLEEEHKALDTSNSALIAQSNALKMVPTLFGIINL